jgi:hypothetical protein
MKRQRTNAQRRAAQRLARLGRSLQARAAGDPIRKPQPPRDPNAPLPPRWAKLFEGFGPSATGWEQRLPDFDLLSPDFELPAKALPEIGPESL